MTGNLPRFREAALIKIKQIAGFQYLNKKGELSGHQAVDEFWCQISAAYIDPRHTEWIVGCSCAGTDSRCCSFISGFAAHLAMHGMIPAIGISEVSHF
jgi:hypothetical protein